MPIDLVAKKLQAQKAVEDYLKSPTNVNTGFLNYANTNENALGQGFQDMVAKYNQGGVTNRYGVSTNPADRYKSQLATEQQGNIDIQNMKNRRDRMTAIYNYAIDQYMNAGMDLETAQNYARQFAMDKSEQEFQANQAASDREYKLKKQNIAKEYGNVMNSMSVDNGDPYAQALYRSIFGLLGTGLAGYTTGAFKSNQQPKTASAYSYNPTALETTANSDAPAMDFGLSNPYKSRY